MAVNFNKLMQEAKQNRAKIEGKLKPVHINNNNGQKYNNESSNVRVNVDINSNVMKKPSAKDGPSSDAIRMFIIKQKMREQEELKQKQEEKRRLLEAREKEQKKKPRKEDEQPSTSGYKINPKTKIKPEEVWKEGEKRSLERKKAEDLAMEAAKQKFKSNPPNEASKRNSINSKSISNEKLKRNDSSSNVYSKLLDVKPKISSNFKIPSIPKISQNEPVDFTKLMKVASINREIDPSHSMQTIISKKRQQPPESMESSSCKKRLKTEKKDNKSSVHMDKDKSSHKRSTSTNKESNEKKRIDSGKLMPKPSSSSSMKGKLPSSSSTNGKLPVSRKPDPANKTFNPSKESSNTSPKHPLNKKLLAQPKNPALERPGTAQKNVLPRRPGTPPKSTHLLPRRPETLSRSALPRRPGTPPRTVFPRRPGTPPKTILPRRPGTPPKNNLPRRPGTPPKTVLHRRPLSDGIQKRPVPPPSFASQAKRAEIEKAALLRREMMFKHPERFRPQQRNSEEVEDEEDSDMDSFIDDSEYDDGGNLVEYRDEIRKMFKYNPNRYKFDDEDDPLMETSFGDIQREEARSARLGLLEDLEDIQREQDELKRKSIHKKAVLKKR